MIKEGELPGMKTAEYPPRSGIASIGRKRTPARDRSCGEIEGIGVWGRAIFKKRSTGCGFGESSRKVVCRYGL